MAHCVISEIWDTETDTMVTACMVHCHYAPCVRDGEPAATEPLHGDDTGPRDEVLTAWMLRTAGQRPLVIHRGRLPGDHDTDAAGSCPCGPELIPAGAS